HPARRAAAARRNRQGPRAAGRLRGLSRRRQHHAMGLCAAGRPGRARQGGVTAAVAFPDITSALKSQMPDLRGRLMANQPLADLTWFRVGGPAQVLFMPDGEDDLAYFLKHLPSDVPVTVIGLGSNLIVRDGGIPGVVVRLGRGFNEVAVEE